jgi:hypothetical protein
MMRRRLLALGAALVVLVLIVLGVKGCLDARARGALSDYSRNVEQIVNETAQTSKRFFDKLEDPGTLSVTEFTGEVNADRSAMANYASRVDDIGAPGEMSDAQHSLELVYELRASAMEQIAAKLPTALGEAGAAKATAGIARQMQKLLASDVIYETVTRPVIDGKLADNGITGDDVPKSTFLPGGTRWLDEDEVSSALGQVSGASGGGGAPGPGVHGLGLLGVGVGGTELSQEVATSVVSEGTPEVEVEVQNQGESTENGITVVVVADGRETTQEIAALEAGATEVAVVPLTPAPEGLTTLEVEVEPVPGEEVATNNEATYQVNFE